MKQSADLPLTAFLSCFRWLGIFADFLLLRLSYKEMQFLNLLRI
jgi:hypothetical protein